MVLWRLLVLSRGGLMESSGGLVEMRFFALRFECADAWGEIPPCNPREIHLDNVTCGD
jgi:hypothetical protein